MQRIALFVSLIAFSGAALAQDPREEAKRHFQNGEAFFRSGDYKSAIAEFKAADKLVPSPILSFNMGLCHEKIGEPEQAVRLFKTYLERRPDAPNRPQVEQRVARLEAEIAQKAKAQKAPPKAAPPAAAKGTPDLYQELDDSPPPAGGIDSAPGAAGVGETGTPAAGATTPGATPAAAPSPVPEDPFARRLPSRRPAGAPGVTAAASAPGAPGAPTASAAPPAPGPAPRPKAPPPAPAEKPAKKSKPVYKEWWFWVVVGVSAIILIDLATSDSNNSENQPVNGAALFRF